MATTLVFQTPLPEFEAIKSGSKSFLLAKFKIAPVKGQRIILQTPDEEIDTVISDVHDEPGLMKGYLILSFPPVQADVIDMTSLKIT